MATPLDSQHPSAYAPPPGNPKRIIVCCDGTWMDSLGAKGYFSLSLFFFRGLRCNH